MPTEIHIPCSDILETIDLGEIKLSRTNSGFLFEAKGGLQTFVHSRFIDPCEMIRGVWDVHKSLESGTFGDEETIKNAETFINAVLYSMQAPIFCSLDSAILYETMAAMLGSFRKYSETMLLQEGRPETEEDVKANVEFEQVSDGLQTIVGAELPDKD